MKVYKVTAILRRTYIVSAEDGEAAKAITARALSGGQKGRPMEQFQKLDTTTESLTATEMVEAETSA